MSEIDWQTSVVGYRGIVGGLKLYEIRRAGIKGAPPVWHLHRVFAGGSNFIAASGDIEVLKRKAASRG